MSPKTIITPEDYKERSFIGDWVHIIETVSQYRDLIKTLVFTNLAQAYKKSLLGIVWLVLQPIFAIILWVLLHAAGLFNPGDSPVPYVGYVLISTSIWAFFVSFYKNISDVMRKDGKVMLRNNFPKIVLVIKQMLVAIVNFLIPFTLSIIVLIILNVKLSWSSLLFIPTIIPLILAGMGLGLVFAVLKLVALDFTTLFDGSFELLKYLTPVVYVKTVESPLIQTIITYNPLTYLIDVPRNLLLGIPVESFDIYLQCSLGAAIFFLLALRFFFLASTWVFEKLMG